MSQGRVSLGKRQELNSIAPVQFEQGDTALYFAIDDGLPDRGYRYIPRWTDAETQGNLFALVQTKRWSDLLTVWAHCSSPIICPINELQNITDLKNPLFSNLKGAPVKHSLETVEWVFASSLDLSDSTQRTPASVRSMNLVEALYSREAIQTLLLLAAYAQGHGRLFDVANLVSRLPFTLARGMFSTWDLEPAGVLDEAGYSFLSLSNTDFDMSALKNLQAGWFDIDVPPRILAGDLFVHYFTEIEKRVGKDGSRLSSEHDVDADSDYGSSTTFSWEEDDTAGSEQKVMRLIADMAIEGHIGVCAYCGLPTDITPRRGGASLYCTNTCRQSMVYKNKAIDWYRSGDSLGLICERLGRFGRPLVQKWITIPTDEEFLADRSKYIELVISRRGELS